MAIQAPPRPIILRYWPWLALFVRRVNLAGPVLDDSIVFTSWWRSAAHNQAVGGHSASQHLIGTAVDVWPANGDQAALTETFRRAGLIPVPSPRGHVHVQLFPAGVRPLV